MALIENFEDTEWCPATGGIDWAEEDRIEREIWAAEAEAEARWEAQCEIDQARYYEARAERGSWFGYGD